MKKQFSHVLFVSTYPPRECGIATFTQDLTRAMDRRFNPKVKSKVMALTDDETGDTGYHEDVIFKAHQDDTRSYVRLAEEINRRSDIKAVNIQHEYKIFGFEYGENLLTFLDALKKPVFTTFHTVLPCPSSMRREIIRYIAEKSECLIVMNNLAVDILRDDYGLRNTNIEVIHHGIHEVPFEASEISKKKLGYDGRIVMSSFGFLRSGKHRKSSGRGYEYVLDALPEIVEKIPDLLYLIIGETHPVVRRKEGEKYRTFLKRKVKRLGLQDNVEFVDKYLQLPELLEYLKATDIYMCSSLNPHQITSGTLSYAMGCGRAVISTPFLHAMDAINNGRGTLLQEFRNSDLIRDAIMNLALNRKLREKMGREAYEYTRSMTWPNVAGFYMELFKKYAKFSL